MEDFATRTYGTSGLDNRPLFGETSAKVSAGVGPGPECEKSRLPPSRWLLAACPEGRYLEVERAGPAIPPPSWDVCPALCTKSRLEWRKVQKVLGSLWEVLYSGGKVPGRLLKCIFQLPTSGVCPELQWFQECTQSPGLFLMIV